MKLKGVKFRTFPHSNSKKRQIDKDKEDREEALEYTTDYPQLRNGEYMVVHAQTYMTT